MKKYPQFVWFIGILFVVNLLWMNHSVSLWDEDEAAYAGFGMTILETGDWVEPAYQWSVIHRKTPFHFWSVAISYKIFGVNEFALRIPSVLAILLTCWFVFLLGRPLFGQKNACRAAIILATSIQLPLMGKIALTDASLLLFQTVGVLSLLNYLYRPSWKWNLSLWFAMGMGILVKGPPIILLIGGMWLLLAVFHPNRKNLIGTHPWFFAWLAMAPFAAWCYASYSQDLLLWEQAGNGIPFAEWWQEEDNGHKIHLLPFLWEWYVLRRIGGSVLGQSGFWGYHLVVLTIAFVTWLPFWFLTLKASLMNFVKPSDKVLTLTIWLVIAWFFWEFMSSKLPSYSMGAQPALALLMAIQIAKLETQEEDSKALKFGVGLYTFIFSIIIIALPIVGVYLLGNWTLIYLLPMSVVLLILLIKLLNTRKDTAKLFQHTAIFGGVFMFLLWTCISPIIEQSSIKSFDEIIETAYQESGEKKATRLIFTGLDIKQQKISLLVYAEQKFGQYEELHAPEAMVAFLEKEAVVLVIGQDAIKPLQAAFKKAKIPFEAQKVLHRSTDDALKSHDFWVIGNKERIE
jgi:4-amino-4-deoxy-L-arabinose transferase-like glycosyltransferase